MSLVDVAIPLIIGSLLIARPQLFVKSTGSAEVMVKRHRTLRAIGYALLGVAALYFVIAVAEKR